MYLLGLTYKSYFFNSFFWSTLSKILNAVLGFISVPLLLGYFGKAEYGILSLATACNGYMQLMDLGMNVGAVKFFSQWEAQGNRGLIHKVARTNITFYIFVSIINIFCLLVLAIWGESIFSVSHVQFLKLRACFIILAVFSVVSWITTVYAQLLTAFKHLAFIMKVQCIITIMKVALIASVFIFDLTLGEYFFYLTFLVACAILPYYYKCKKNGYIDSYKPSTHWNYFRVVFKFSLSLFALSLFQVTATQSRPIILSILSVNGADTVADFRIIEVIPQFIITVCGTFISIFLPKSSEMMINSGRDEIQSYINKWTARTTILVCALCFPFVVDAHSILSAYVGSEYQYLAQWLQLWCVFLIVQMHSTPAFSFVLATGKTKVLVIWTSIACLLSMIINVLLCNVFQIGSAVIGYGTYILCLIWVYYIYIYKHFLDLNRLPIFLSFFKPFMIGFVCLLIPYFLNIDYFVSGLNINVRVGFLFHFLVSAMTWIVPYFILLLVFKQISMSDLIKKKELC